MQTKLLSMKEKNKIFCGAVDVNPEMAAQLIHVLHSFRKEVYTIVAPYEADAQVSKL